MYIYIYLLAICAKLEPSCYQLFYVCFVWVLFTGPPAKKNPRFVLEATTWRMRPLFFRSFSHRQSQWCVLVPSVHSTRRSVLGVFNILGPKTNECPLKMNGWFRCCSQLKWIPFKRTNSFVCRKNRGENMLISCPNFTKRDRYTPVN